MSAPDWLGLGVSDRDLRCLFQNLSRSRSKCDVAFMAVTGVIIRMLQYTPCGQQIHSGGRQGPARIVIGGAKQSQEQVLGSDASSSKQPAFFLGVHNRLARVLSELFKNDR